MAWCPNCKAAGGKGKTHDKFAHQGGGVCGRYSLSFAKAKELFCPADRGDGWMEGWGKGGGGGRDRWNRTLH